MKPDHGYEALRRLRMSRSNTDYFLTICTNERRTGLTNPEVAHGLREEIEAIECAAHWTIRGAVIMPDHLHLLFTLHSGLPLGRAIARLKSKTKPALSTASIRWQGNYYEHRLREGDPLEAVILYISLNPYRAGVIAPSENYPWFWLGRQETAWFKPQSDDGRPFPEWLC